MTLPDRIDPRPPGRIYRWDLDKTYLQTEFDTLRQLVRTAFQRARQKVAVPGARVLSQIPGTEVRIIERCSAVDGTWGMKAAYYDEGRRYARRLADAELAGALDLPLDDLAATRGLAAGAEPDLLQTLQLRTADLQLHGNTSQRGRAGARTG